MGNEADNDVAESERGSSGSPSPDDAGPDQTMRLDAAIVNGSLSLPSHFGRYRVADRIGAGGFASVYSAFDPELDSLVAIKVLAENHSANVGVRKRFVAEARVARRLGSDRLIGVFDLGETNDGRPFVVMELAERGTLRQRLVRTGRPSHHDLIRLIEELASCMTALHEQGVVHRDIKPSNLLFRASNPTDPFEPHDLIHDDERLVLGDLGMARDISDGASAVTVGGGTEGYMAPEQADPRGKADYRADIYSATVVLAELTTGRHPQRLDLPSADITTPVLEALATSLSIDREKRPSTAAEWRDRLVDAYQGLEHGASADQPTGRLDTAPLDPTKIQAPYPYNTQLGPPTEVPEAGTGPSDTAVAPFVDERSPAPPPGLPIPPDRQPPPPRLVEEPTPSAPPVATAPPSPTAPFRHGDSTDDLGGPEQPSSRVPTNDTGPGQTTPADGSATTPAPAGAVPEASAVADTPPATPDQEQAEPQMPAPPNQPAASAAPPSLPPTDDRPATRQPSIDDGPDHPSRPTESRAATPPATRDSRVAEPEQSPPARPDFRPPTAAPPVAEQPAAPALVPSRPPQATAPGSRPGAATPQAPGRGQSTGPPPVVRPPRSKRRRRKARAASAPPITAPPITTPPPSTAETAKTQSRKHLKTAERLAKLERKQNRKLARRARRRRRRLRVVNFVLALIRGSLAALVALFSGSLIASAALGVSLDSLGQALDTRPGAQVLLIGGTIMAFIWGLTYFPFPRSYEI